MWRYESFIKPNYKFIYKNSPHIIESPLLGKGSRPFQGELQAAHNVMIIVQQWPRYKNVATLTYKRHNRLILPKWRHNNDFISFSFAVFVIVPLVSLVDFISFPFCSQFHFEFP